MRAYVHKNGDEMFVFFFDFDLEPKQKFVEFFGHRIDLELGGKSSGVVRLSGNKISGYLVKGVNEVEGTTTEIKIRMGDQEIIVHGDGSEIARGSKHSNSYWGEFYQLSTVASWERER